MQRELKFSVIIPVYNADKYLRACLDSVLAQSYPHWEIIAIDDCSSDGSVELVKEYTKDPRIKLVTNSKNQGPGKLRNMGIGLAEGDWILFLDSDDWYEKELLKKLAGIVVEHQNLNVIEFPFYVGKNDGEKKRAEWMDRGESGVRITAKEDIMIATGIWKGYKRSFLIDNRLTFMEDNRSGEEIPLHICAMILAGEFYYLNYPGYNWRVNNSSLSRDPKKNDVFLKGVWIMIEGIQKMMKNCEIYERKRFDVYALRVLSWHLREKISFSYGFYKYYRKVRSFYRKAQLKQKDFEEYKSDYLNRFYKKYFKGGFLLSYFREVIGRN